MNISDVHVNDHGLVTPKEVLLMEEIVHQLIGSYPIVYRVSYISGGAGFLPSKVGKFKNDT